MGKQCAYAQHAVLTRTHTHLKFFASCLHTGLSLCAIHPDCACCQGSDAVLFAVAGFLVLCVAGLTPQLSSGACVDLFSLPPFLLLACCLCAVCAVLMVQCVTAGGARGLLLGVRQGEMQACFLLDNNTLRFWYMCALKSGYRTTYEYKCGTQTEAESS